MTHLLICLTVLLLGASSVGATDTITVGSYNCEAFFDLTHDNTEFPAYSEELWNITSYRAKLHNIASVITALQADILTLNEIESHAVLTELQKELKRNKSSYPYAYIAPMASRQGFSVALLSNYPILKTKISKVTLPNKRVSRDILQTDLLIASDTLTVISCHWPSKLHPESYRIAAAKVVRRVVDSLPKNRPIIISGDLNSNHDEATLLVGSSCGGSPCDDRQGVTGINHILKTYTSLPGMAPKNFVPTDNVRGFFNPWHDIASATDWSYIYQNGRLTIDHILLSGHFFRNGPFSYIPHSFTSFDNQGKLLLDGLPYRWQIARGETPQHLNRGYSDHLPVKLHLVHNAQKTTSFKPSVLLGSFEQARDGWISASKEVYLYLTDSLALEGKQALVLRGTPKKNVSITTLTYRVQSEKKNFSLAVQGEGSLCFRMKSSSSKKWRYFSNSGAAQSSATYLKKKWPTWTTIRFPRFAPPGDTITIQLRSKGGEKLHLLIDQVSDNGWAR